MITASQDMNATFKRMDHNRLGSFLAMTEQNKPDLLATNEASLLKADSSIDLRGKKCPMPFVYTKLELEKLLPNQVLEIVLDYEPSFTTVPRSVTIQKLGEVIQESEEHDGVKILWIKKI
jgi:TusA-related sulfurtransferase